MTTIWELDFYSRPILDDNQKKLWEVLICETPLDISKKVDSLFRYSQFCSNQTVNSLWLRSALEKAIAEAGETPQKIRFFRRQMNNMISKACEELDITPAASRRTYSLDRWIDERMETFYPQQPGYEASAPQSSSVQYPQLNAIALPDAVRGDKSDKWAFVTLQASAFADINEWDIAFGEVFPLSLADITPQTQIPGLIIFSPRALPLAGWMSGLELAFLQIENSTRPIMRLETGASDSWIIANITNPQTLEEAQKFEMTKKNANQVHFLAIQSDPQSQSFSGFWLLKS